jgi:tetratricopeptide (TPR) repeat protein
VTTLDLHPEEMLDAARRGTLSARAEADLSAHLGRCAACRLSLSLPADLRAESAATSADAPLLEWMVRGALAGEPRVAASPAARGSIRNLGRRVAVAALLLLVGGSAGAAMWASRDRLAGRFRPEILQLPALVRPHPSAPRAVASSPVSSVAPIVEPMLAPVVTPALARPPHQRIEARVERSALSADALFAEANRARREGDYLRALRGYAELRRDYPGTREEITARVVVGDLRLAEGAARDALASYDGYLAATPDGTLAEEARVGRALALMRLGRRDEERQAWTQVLRLHPDSVQGARARSRLAELR